MRPFWTVTDVDTQKTNSRSVRYTSEGRATDEARDRIHAGKSPKGVVIMKAVKLVELQQAPVKISDIGELENPMAPDRGDLGKTVLTREDDEDLSPEAPIARKKAPIDEDEDYNAMIPGDPQE